MSANPKTEYTAEDLLRMPDGDRYELVEGKLVDRMDPVTNGTAEQPEEHSMGLWADLVAGQLYLLLSAFCHSRGLGWVLIPNSGGFHCGPTRLVRKPDVAFVRRGRFPDDRPPTGHGAFAPDLAVEVISPNDLYEEVETKVREYLRSGVRLVWLVSPTEHTVRVCRPDGSSRLAQESDELSGEDVIPGFRCRVGDLFPTLPPPGSNGEPKTPSA